jgi:hypothetical protein
MRRRRADNPDAGGAQHRLRYTILAMGRILVGTDDGVHEFEARGVSRRQLPGRRVTALSREGWECWGILDDSEVWHTAGVDWWFRVAALEGLRATCLADTRAGVVVGTEEAHLFRVAGEGLEQITTFERIDGRDDWYTPWGSPADTRSISESDEYVYVNIHVGGIVRSNDRGETWEPTIDIHSDVHKVRVGTDHVFAACALGLAVSEDGGGSWTMRTEGLHSTYARGVAQCGQTVLLSVSDGPRGGRSALYRGPSDGGTLERCSHGLPEWFDDNIDSACLDSIPELVAFATRDGQLFASEDEGVTWSEVTASMGTAHCLLVMP